MRLIGELLRPYRWLVALIFAVMLVDVGMTLAGPWPLKIVLDNVVGNHPLPHWLESSLEAVGGRTKMHVALLAAIMLALIAVISAVASYVVNYLTETVGQRVANDLRLRTYHHLQELSLSYYDTHRVGPIVSTITDDVDTIQDFASESTLGMAIDTITILGMVVLMFWLDWDFALIAVAVAPFLLLFVSRIRRAVKKATHEVRRRQADIVAAVSQGLESMRVVEALDRHDFEEQKLAQISERTVAAALGARRVKSLVSPIVAVVVAFCTAFVLWRGSSLILSGAMTAGTLTVFIAYLTNFFKPVQDLAKMTNTIAATSVAIDRVSDLLDTSTTIPERPNAAEPESLRGEVTFDRVGFDYGAGTPVLRDLSFTVSPGQMVGIVGPTGSGKSTIVSLVPRFYDVTAGRVTIDGIDVRDYKLHAIRNQIGFVLQDTVLFGGTVRDNIAFGRPDATDDEIVATAKLANAHEFILAMPEGYDSLVGERGLTLSGGQRQRIGIARALIRDDPMLILDEPTAALDAASEQSVMEALQRLMKDRTVMVIAHRLSTIREADNIVVLKDGVIAEQGTHHALMASDGVYAALHRIQSDSGAD